MRISPSVRRRAPAVALAAVLVVLSACSDSGDGSVDDGDDLAAQVQSALDELVAMPGAPPGAVIVVQVGDDEQVFTAGVAEVGNEAPPAPDDHMRVASVAKAFSGATALSLVDEGKLTLDDTIGERLPDLPEAWGAVTLRQLLAHTSGVPDIVGSPKFGEAVSASPDDAPAPRELLTAVEDEPLVFPPGTQYEYSNSDNFVVALMVEQATGTSYATALADHVLEPLGLDQTSLPEGSEMPSPTLHGYDFDEDGVVEDLTTSLAAGWSWASGGVVSTPNDLNDFIRGYVSGELYEQDSTREAQQDLFIPAGGSEPPGPGLNSASMALFRYQTPCGTMYGHSGNTFGYTQFAAATADGERSVTASMTVQRTPDSEGQGASVFDALQRAEQAAMCLALEGS